MSARARVSVNMDKRMQKPNKSIGYGYCHIVSCARLVCVFVNIIETNGQKDLSIHIHQNNSNAKKCVEKQTTDDRNRIICEKSSISTNGTTQYTRRTHSSFIAERETQSPTSQTICAGFRIGSTKSTMIVCVWHEFLFLFLFYHKCPGSRAHTQSLYLFIWALCIASSVVICYRAQCVTECNAQIVLVLMNEWTSEDGEIEGKTLHNSFQWFDNSKPNCLHWLLSISFQRPEWAVAVFRDILCILWRSGQTHHHYCRHWFDTY